VSASTQNQALAALLFLFVFPAARICRDPRWGAPSRFHLHESASRRLAATLTAIAGSIDA
jgi:hypothetical protein